MSEQTAIITGSYGDIGNAIAKRFVANKIKVALVGRDINKLKSQRNELSKIKKTDISILEVDIRDSKNLKESLENIVKSWGRIDVLVNNAGLTRDNIILRMSDEDWDDVIDSNLTSVFNMTKLFIKSMVKNRSGRIINISSVAGLMGNPGQVNQSNGG
mgnify:CR=1 FL=1